MYSLSAQDVSDDMEELMGPAPNVVRFPSPVSPLDRPLLYTRFVDYLATTKWEKARSLRQLAEIVDRRREDIKARLPWIKLATFGDERTGKACLRHGKNMREISGIEGDYDGKNVEFVTLSEGVARLRAAGVAALIYASPSHTAASPRWRVLAPLSRNHTPAERAALCARLNGALGGALEDESFTMAQAYYFGRLTDSPDFEAHLIDGGFLDLVEGLPEVYPAGKSAASASAEPLDELELDLKRHKAAESFKADLASGKLSAALKAIAENPNGNDSYSGDWGVVARALCHASAGSGEGFDAFMGWVEVSPRMARRAADWSPKKVRDQAAKDWNRYSRRDDHGDPQTLGSLYTLAQAAGWAWDNVQPDPDDLEDLDASEPAAQDDTPIARMNRLHAVLPVGGHERILTLRGRQGYSIGTAEDLRLRYQPHSVLIGEDRKPLANAWLGSKLRRAFPEGVTFLPGKAAPEGAFNAWRGWAVDPDARPEPESRCARILDHLRFVFGDHAEWGLDWIADMFQRPWQKPGTTVIARGQEGAGKDIPGDYLGKILGLHRTVIADPKHLTGQFNGHLAKAVLVHASDSVWGGDRAAGGKLRAMVTQAELPLEHKGQDVVMVASFQRFWISTNASWAIEAAMNSRRWFVVEVPSDRIGHVAYFDAIAAEMDGEGPAALLSWLLARKITHNLRKAPETAPLAKQRLETLRGPEAWIASCVEAGEILGADPTWIEAGDWPEGCVKASSLRDACEAWLRGGRHRGDMSRPEEFGRVLKPFTNGGLTYLPRSGQKVQSRGYKFLDLDECRATLGRLYGAPEI